MTPLQDTVLSLALAAAVLLVRQTLWMPLRVKGRSMQPTLLPGDRLWVSRLRRRKVRRGDVVICHYPGRYWRGHKWIRPYFVKRVIGLPGERIAVSEGVVHIDGEPLMEPWLNDAQRGRRTMAERTIGPAQVFVMGDNRIASHDSRSIGPIDSKLVVGVVTAIWWPASRAGRAVSRLHFTEDRTE